VLKEPDLDPNERAEIMEAQAALDRVGEAALISRGLGISVTPWALDDWPLDERLAARALARKWIRNG
jgi:hypothetical protein